jgi:ADP-ribose pyrophosphatase YjhB (NUDIX family)
MASSVSDSDLVRWSESLAAIARTGLGFSPSLYEQERYEEILKIAAEMRLSVREGSRSWMGVSSAGELSEEWMRLAGGGVEGYVTPKLAVGAVVLDTEGRILLVQRADSGVWLYPTGWADVGYSAAEVVVKEVWEETGVRAEPTRLIAVLDGLRVGLSQVPLYSLVFLCRPLGGELRAHPLECADVGWFPLDDLPKPIAGVDRWGPVVRAALAGERPDVAFDQPRRWPWEEVEDHLGSGPGPS